MTRAAGTIRQKGLGPQGVRPNERTVTRIDTLLQQIRLWAIQNGHNPHSIAVGTGLSAGALRFLWKPTWNPNSETIRSVELFIVQQEEAKRRILTSPFVTPLQPTADTAPSVFSDWGLPGQQEKQAEPSR